MALGRSGTLDSHEMRTLNIQQGFGAGSNVKHLFKGILAAPPKATPPPQEIAGLIKGLLTIGFP